MEGAERRKQLENRHSADQHASVKRGQSHFRRPTPTNAAHRCPVGARENWDSPQASRPGPVGGPAGPVRAARIGCRLVAPPRDADLWALLSASLVPTGHRRAPTGHHRQMVGVGRRGPRGNGRSGRSASFLPPVGGHEGRSRRKGRRSGHSMRSHAEHGNEGEEHGNEDAGGARPSPGDGTRSMPDTFRRSCSPAQRPARCLSSRSKPRLRKVANMRTFSLDTSATTRFTPHFLATSRQ